MFGFLRHFLLPHYSNNQRAKLLHSQTIFLLILLLLGTTFLFSTTKQHLSGVLGVSVDISSQDLLLLTNIQRSHAGLSVLQLDSQLSQAAEAKAQDMFAKDYWAHFAPDGTSPWDFIHAAGYNYVYAGENLARGFTTAQDTINAWMASPEHRANMLSSHYTDVGFAVERGRLPGDADTILVVQMFGSKTFAPTLNVPPVVALSENAQKATPTPASRAAEPIARITITPIPSSTPVLAAVRQHPLFDSAYLSKSISLTLLSLFLIVFALDIILTESRKSVRLAGHSFDHLLFLLSILAIAISLGTGVIS